MGRAATQGEEWSLKGESGYSVGRAATQGEEWPLKGVSGFSRRGKAAILELREMYFLFVSNFVF